MAAKPKPSKRPLPKLALINKIRIAITARTPKSIAARL